MNGWDPDQYLKFAGPRLAPALDLLARVDVEGPKVVFDLGCGAGRMAAMMALRWPAARVVGIDSSPEMWARAQSEHPGMAFQQADIAGWRADTPAHVIYSNAVLHWLDDHPGLLTRLMGELAPGGVLAVQMPRNHHAPSHTLMAEVAGDGPWAQRLVPLLRPNPVAEPDVYEKILSPSAKAVDVWETVYEQTLEGDHAVFEWLRGTALKPLLDALEGSDWKDDFINALTARLARAYPKADDGTTAFAFRRLFMVAKKA